MLEEFVSEEGITFEDASNMIQGLKGHHIDTRGNFLDTELNYSRVLPKQVTRIIDIYFNPSQYVMSHEITLKHVIVRDYAGLIHKIILQSASKNTQREDGNITISYRTGTTKLSREILFNRMYQNSIDNCPSLQEKIDEGTGDDFAEEKPLSELAVDLEALNETKPVKGVRRLLRAVYEALVGKNTI